MDQSEERGAKVNEKRKEWMCEEGEEEEKRL